MFLLSFKFLYPPPQEPEQDREELLEAIDADVSENSLIRQYRMTDLDAASDEEEMESLGMYSTLKVSDLVITLIISLKCSHLLILLIDQGFFLAT